MPDALRARFLTALDRHGRYLELNLSVYFSPNTHLLGEAVALHALGVLFPEFPHAARWAKTGGRLVEQQMERQVRADGSHFEQSAYYHVYALDFFLLYRLLAKPPAAYDARLVAMAEYLDALLGVNGTLPLIGDDDGGRVFHPYGERAGFGRATMATCSVLFHRPEWLRGRGDLCEQAAWWLGPEALSMRAAPPAPRVSRFFADGGTAIMASDDVQLVIKAGPFGEGSGGHSHSDVLSLTARAGGREILIDPGTFTYVADPAERNRFRGSAAHNTVRIDGRDQAVPGGPFRWNHKPSVNVRQWSTRPERDYLDATCAYAGFTHRRRIVFVKPATVIVLDTVDGPSGDHTLEQFWHLDSAEDAARFSFSAPAEVVDAWRSRALCSREPATALCVTVRGPLPAHMAAVLDLSESPTSGGCWRFGPMGTRSWWAVRRGTRPEARSGFPQTGSTASSDKRAVRRLYVADYDTMHLQEKVHFLARQFQRGGDLLGALAAPVHAQCVGAFAEVESRPGYSGRRRDRRMILQVVDLGGQRLHGVTQRLVAGVAHAIAFRRCVGSSRAAGSKRDTRRAR